MYQQERMDQIMKILKENHYVTVDYLVKEIRYSPASIRRDLSLLEKQGLVTRSYGGVTYKDENFSPFRFRQHSIPPLTHLTALLIPLSHRAVSHIPYGSCKKSF